jgi:hypothetical protein
VLEKLGLRFGGLVEYREQRLARYVIASEG